MSDHGRTGAAGGVPLTTASVVSDCAAAAALAPGLGPVTRGTMPPRYSKLQSTDLDSGYLSSQLLSGDSLSSVHMSSLTLSPRCLSPAAAESHPAAETHGQTRLQDPTCQAADRTDSLLDSGVQLDEAGCVDSAVLSDLSRLSVTQRAEESERERAAWEQRYVATLTEAFSGDEDGDTHLHLAIMYRFSGVAEKLISLVPHRNFLSLGNSYRQTPLHLSVLCGDAALTRRLVVAGADPAATDRHGDTPLHLACRRADRGCVHALTEPVSAHEQRAAKLQYQCCPAAAPAPAAAQLVDAWNFQGLSCLHLAVLSGDVELVAHLVCHGASIDATEGKAGRSVCHLAAEAGDIDMLRFLAEACGALLDRLNYAGLTAHQVAALNRRWDVAELLIQLGAADRPLPDSDMDSDSDSEHEGAPVQPEDVYSDVRIRGQPLVTAQ